MIPKIEWQHARLMKEIQDYDHSPIMAHNGFFPLSNRLSQRNFEELQADALTHELLLQKLRQRTIIVRETQELVIKRLYTTALKQTTKWAIDQRHIHDLRQYLLKSPNDSSSSTFGKIPRRCQMPVNKPLPRAQLKHFKG